MFSSYLESAWAFSEVYTTEFLLANPIKLDFIGFMDPLEQFRVTFTAYNWYFIASMNYEHFLYRVEHFYPLPLKLLKM